jgi:predicted regulator of Ras-like GTPase activity (Roadblock/LC7/MglB family)
MTASFRRILESLMHLRGALGTLLVDEHDGMIIDAILQAGQDGERVAAIAASLHRKARKSAEAAGLGAVGFLQLDAPGGRICAAGRGNLVLVVVAAPTANLGMVRVELLRGVQALP